MTRAGINPEAPAIFVRTRDHSGKCAEHERCRWYRQQMHEVLVGRYIAPTIPFEKQIVAAWIPLSELDGPGFEQRLRRHSRGAGLRQARRAARAGYRTRAIDPREHIETIAAVNLSLAERNGKPMTAPYRRTAAELARDAETAIEFQPAVCVCHWDRWRAICRPDSGDLCGYVRLRRNGNYVLYAQWLGHGDDLGQGIMHELHQETVRWLLESDDPAVQGIAHLVYSAWLSGGEGLQRWKRAAGFEAAWMVLARDEPAP